MAEQAGKDVCSICLNEFHQPKVIDCQHSFCLTCLEDYVNKTSTNGQFLCPLCRQEFPIPAGGVTEYDELKPNNGDNSKIIPQCDVCTNNLSMFNCKDCEQYLCDSCKTTHDKLKVCKDHVVVRTGDVQHSQVSRDKDFCSNHEVKEARCYCEDCRVAICSDCTLFSHKDHNFLDLQDVKIQSKAREDLKSLQGDLQSQIKEFEKYYDNLTHIMADINKSADVSCQSVEQRIEQICLCIRRLGEEVQVEILKLRDDELNKISKLMGDMKSLIDDLKTLVKNSGDILEDTSQSTAQVLNKAQSVEKVKKENSLKNLNMPEIKYTWLEETVIDEDVLKKQLGILENLTGPTFITQFNFQTVQDEVKGVDYIIMGQPWKVAVQKGRFNDKPSLGVYLYWAKVENTNCTVNCKLTLVNKNNLRSETRDFDYTITPKTTTTGRGTRAMAYWTELANKQNGFLDKDDNFIIKATVKVKKIEISKLNT
ncbi:tripartite motif-containing protein 45-like [Patella vulgata]|uniref:tripartite motif-containing protein 45-like n=1 Tax=Patella vulgata TaxID=6465 RepID=UPI002180429F|nr:tripartite motif-containing protein 45-like [Patella vulgata]